VKNNVIFSATDRYGATIKLRLLKNGSVSVTVKRNRSPRISIPKDDLCTLLRLTHMGKLTDCQWEAEEKFMFSLSDSRRMDDRWQINVHQIRKRISEWVYVTHQDLCDMYEELAGDKIMSYDQRPKVLPVPRSRVYIDGDGGRVLKFSFGNAGWLRITSIDSCAHRTVCCITFNEVNTWAACELINMFVNGKLTTLSMRVDDKEFFMNKILGRNGYVALFSLHGKRRSYDAVRAEYGVAVESLRKFLGQSGEGESR